MGNDPHEGAPESGLRLPGRAGPAGKAVVVVALATAVFAAGCTGDSDSGGGASSEAESRAATPDADLVLSAEDGSVPDLAADEVDGALTVPPTSVAFVVVDGASPDRCGAGD